MNISLSKNEKAKGDQIILVDDKNKAKSILSKDELKVFSKSLKADSKIINLSSLGEAKFLVLLDSKNSEANRKLGSELVEKVKSASFADKSGKSEVILSFLEGAYLKDYHFDKYKNEKEDKNVSWNIISSQLTKEGLSESILIWNAVFQTRDWVNEPVNKLNTTQYIKQIKSFEKIGVDVEVYRKSKLKALNMGGILGVNQGSNEEPALVKCEWKPKNAKNKKPIVLVGKGVLFDTGGINIKTGNFMNDMKADMSGSSTVLGALKAFASMKLPVYVIVLTPITENRINGDELVPGDVISMHNGKTVEVLNTDAEGRLILADALSFAKKFNPQLVIDAATLTGSAYRITGYNGGVVMGNDSKNIAKLRKEGEKVFERLVELPMWEEFEETLKSDVADINNLGSSEGQAVCAGFFLKNFVDYPWIHLDIAGPAFRSNSKDYLPKGGTGFGVRLLYQFIKNNFTTSN